MNFTDNWQFNRSHLNHNWLQNRMCVGLIHLLSIARGHIELNSNDHREMNFLKEWNDTVPEIRKLVCSFVDCMSPKNLFTTTCLAILSDDTKWWMGEVSEEIWKIEVRCSERITSALNALEFADSQYHLLINTLQDYSFPCQATYEHDQVIDSLLAFHKACRDLSSALSKFPRQVGIPDE